MVHYYRGAFYFPTGEIEGCLRETRSALDYARKSESAMEEALALSGLGDAYYSLGRVNTAHDHFDECTQLSRGHGFSRIEAGSLNMCGMARYFQNDLVVRPKQNVQFCLEKLKQNQRDSAKIDESSE